jgi:hypothetical protein
VVEATLAPPVVAGAAVVGAVVAGAVEGSVVGAAVVGAAVGAEVVGADVGAAVVAAAVGAVVALAVAAALALMVALGDAFTPTLAVGATAGAWFVVVDDEDAAVRLRLPEADSVVLAADADALALVVAAALSGKSVERPTFPPVSRLAANTPM